MFRSNAEFNQLPEIHLPSPSLDRLTNVTRVRIIAFFYLRSSDADLFLSSLRN
jgi:hypothetical protein